VHTEQQEAKAARKAKEAEEATRITVARLADLFLEAKAGLPWIEGIHPIAAALRAREAIGRIGRN